jgi:hypothetical protein
MIDAIERSSIFSTRDGDKLWFHPRACAIPVAGGPPLLLMTAQSISGSDVFGHVHWTTSADGGRTWSEPEPIPDFGRRPWAGDNRVVDGICDAVPELHPATGKVIVLAHNVYYQDDVLTMPDRERYVVYSVFDPATSSWSGRNQLAWEEPLASAMYTSNCSQRVSLANGDVIVPLSFGPLGRRDRMVCTVRCSFDGESLSVAERGPHHELAENRGLLEPSVTRVADRFFLTVRAEDERGYVSSSGDGLAWQPLRAWAWDDGEVLTMSTTQQRWLPHSEALHLVYTRRAEENSNVMRWRSPLYLAEVDRERLCLLRDTEQIVLPMKGDGIADPDSVPRMGNFHTTIVSPQESILTTGESWPTGGYEGETLLARIRWRQPNQLASV